MKITKKKLLEAVAKRVGGMSRLFADPGAGVVEAARHLGYEVVDGPELPERLVVGNLEQTSILDEKDGYMPVLVRAVGSSPEYVALIAELVRRYNAREKVLELAVEIGQGWNSILLSEQVLLGWAARLRAAYEEAEA